MTAPRASAGRRYLELAGDLVERLLDGEWANIDRAADLVADLLARGGTIHAFGTGHSHVLAEELYYRAGGFVRVNPILFEGLMLHSSALLSTSLERMPGLAEALLADHPIASGDVLVVASNSGRNAVTAELAQAARAAGASVIAVTSLRHATAQEARTQGLPRLHEVADVVIDNGGVVGDAAIDIEGFEVRVAPTSTARRRGNPERHDRRGRRAPGGAWHTPGGLHEQQCRRRGRRERPVPVARERSVIRNGAATPFAIRGVIEGFYGNPWTREQRLELIEFLAAHGMNTFVYAPKDDPLVRRAWREAYTGDDLQRLTELVELCAAHGIELVYCLSPGLSIRYSDPGDIEALSAKFSSVAALGVRTSVCCSTTSRPTSSTRRIGPPSPTSPERMFTSSTR